MTFEVFILWTFLVTKMSEAVAWHCLPVHTIFQMVRLGFGPTFIEGVERIHACQESTLNEYNNKIVSDMDSAKKYALQSRSICSTAIVLIEF